MIIVDIIKSFNLILEIIAALFAIIFVPGGVIWLIRKNKQEAEKGGLNNNSDGDAINAIRSNLGGANNGSVSVVGNHNVISQTQIKAEEGSEEPHEDVIVLKETCHILFIDDEKSLSVIKTLHKSGWKYIQRIGDTANLDLPEIRMANIIFVDIKGVGLLLQFKNEGVGLAASIKRRYKEKGVVIYSATEEHNLFDPDIKEVDDWLYKNADPIQFSNMIEQYGRPKN